LLCDWTSKFKGKVIKLEEDLRALTFDVLAVTAFPESTHEEGRHRGVAPEWINSENHTQSYREILHIVLENSILLMLIPYRRLTGRLVPRRLARIGRAAAAYKSILMKLVDDEARAINPMNNGGGSSSNQNNNDTGPRGLLTTLVRALEETNAGKEDDKTRRGGLSPDEILGNAFTINFAGHDTVLIALTFALTLLAVIPEVQGWLREEITTISQGQPLDSWDYSQVFPKLNRCHAVLLETLRLFAPITGVPKMTSVKAAVSFRLSGGHVLNIPPGTEVFPLLLGVQTDPRYWEDPYEWRPSRWIRAKPGGNLSDEELLAPRKGTFFPWSDGPQICAGKKFSQVEGVAILAQLFCSHCLQVDQREGETESEARKRVRDCADDVNYDLMLRMNHSHRVRLRCVKLDSG
jgi:cytochrome P450